MCSLQHGRIKLGNYQKHCVNQEGLETGDCQAAQSESPHMQTSENFFCLKKKNSLREAHNINTTGIHCKLLEIEM